MNQKLRSTLDRTLYAVLWFFVSLYFVWAAGAIYYLTWLPKPLTVVLSLAFFGGGIWLLLKLPKKRRWLQFAAAAIIAVYVLCLTQRPSTDRMWAPEQAKLPQVMIADGGHVQIDNFRHCTFRSETDFDVAHRAFDFELEQLDKVWFLVQRFTATDGLAHTFVTFQVNGEKQPKFFSVSVEIRREQHETYSPIQGLYRQYELFYAIGDERDIIGQRTNLRPTDRVYMYEVNATPKQVQQLFVDIAQRTQTLRQQPEFYHTLLNNCTNNIVSHTYKLTPEPINPMDVRIAVPGYSAKFAYEMGLIGDKSQPYEELQSKCRIDKVAKAAGITPSFSIDIRHQLP